jgi:hypothetical protein
LARSLRHFSPADCGRKAAYIEALRRAREAKERQNGANGMSDMAGSEPDWQSREVAVTEWAASEYNG